MRTLHLYLTRQTLVTLIMTVAVFTFVLLLGNVLREIFALLVNRQATLDLVLEAVSLLIPYVLVFALPMGMLAATLLVFGRFSADQELTAVRASGISLVSLVTPILLLSVIVSGLCAVLNLSIGPQCRLAYKRLLHRFGMERMSVLLTENRFIHDIPNTIIYIGKIDGSDLENVHYYRLQDGQVVERMSAPTAHLQMDPEGSRAVLTLTNVIFETRSGYLEMTPAGRQVERPATNTVHEVAAESEPDTDAEPGVEPSAGEPPSEESPAQPRDQGWVQGFSAELPKELDFAPHAQFYLQPTLKQAHCDAAKELAAPFPLR